MNSTQKKSCLRQKNKTNYCRVQFIEEAGYLTTPPDSPVEALIDSHMMMYEHLYKKEKERTQLLETQIQHLQIQLMDRDQRLERVNKDEVKYAKVSHLVNHILALSTGTNSNNNECTSSLESIHDYLQHILFHLMVAQRQQTRYDDDDLSGNNTDYHPSTDIYY
ncbi:hypothetical protein BC941DRAFT_472973 [Chlamydoabsidia padenii]|nr:hypothetical protein BC941DRAFT_472973 [Chlamydoabsidia padenii]